MNPKVSQKKKWKSVEEYISSLPENKKSPVLKLRKAILEAAPGAEETISYNMPGFRYHGMLVWFAANKNHVGFYPKGSGIEFFRTELSAFECSKGTVKFPLDRPLPLTLIRKIVRFRVKENLSGSAK